MADNILSHHKARRMVRLTFDVTPAEAARIISWVDLAEAHGTNNGTWSPLDCEIAIYLTEGLHVAKDDGDSLG